MSRSRKEVPVLSGAYLEGAGSKNETIRRLAEITSILTSTEITPSQNNHPSLSSLPPALITILSQTTDAKIRLHAILLCMELFYVYAPTPPWDTDDTLAIFDHTVRQLGNLGGCTPDTGEFENYFRILEMLSEIKIGVVLVDLIQTRRDDDDKRPVETLASLIRGILNGVNVDHPPEVGGHAETAVAACLEEFEGAIPAPVLDELLLAAGAGPVVYVPNPEYSRAAAKRKKDLPQKEIQQTNCAYLVAAKVIRRAEDKVSSAVAGLLNGLLGGEESVLRETCIPCHDSEEWGVKKKGTIVTKEEVNVYSIVYELHRIAPNILTTVIGTVASSLVSGDVGARGRATKLLGRLFGARTSDVARRFGPCFREWLKRSNDSEPKIRETMVKCLINFLANKHAETELCEHVNETLAEIIRNDPNLDVRLLAIHQTCDLIHNANCGESEGSNQTQMPITVISADLLLAIGNRVESKVKSEHKDAITGLAQIYHRHYLKKKLAEIQEGGDDINIGEILDTLRAGCLAKKKKQDKFAWIPQKVFDCVYYQDASDPEMRSRVFQIVDDVLLGSSKSTSLSQTTRAVGLAMILHSLTDNAKKWMAALFGQRANLQRLLGLYLDARLKAKEFESGSAEAFTADAEAMEKLERVADFAAPISGSSPANEEVKYAILKKFHTAKDKHIFRILSTIATPTHSPNARARAFDELPKRTKSLGNETSSWVKTLARRCAMGSFFNVDIIEHCIILSQESFEAGDCEASALFLDCIKSATSVFPALAATEEGFKNLAEFFESSRNSSVKQSTKKDMEKFGLVTSISDILAKVASSRPASNEKSQSQAVESTETLRAQLLRLCTRDGSPEQARNSVHAIASLINPQSKSSDLVSRIRKEKEEFLPLLKALVNPSRLSIPDDEDSNHKHKSRIISVLSAIAAISECAPYAFNASGDGGKKGWGQRALDFALGTVLMGRRQSLNASMDVDEDSESENEDDSPKKKSRKREASIHCKMICGAIEVLISHIKFTVISLRADATKTKKSSLEPLSSTYLVEVFGVLSKIIEDGGVPPSSVNDRYCKTEEDRAALRCCAAVNLLKLCDSSLYLEHKYLTPRMWHVLSSALLDTESSVRGAVMEELSALYGSKYIPSMRFVSLITLCVDGEQGHPAVNARAANVGRKCSSTKGAATICIKKMRTAFQSNQAQARSLGREAEKNFEHKLKQRIMPEYSLPFALHLLAFRHETPGAAGALNADDSMLDDDELADAEAAQRMLKKRLKSLFDPLIKSLGDGADNISFLLRMVELVGKHPLIDVKNASNSSLEIDFDDESVNDGEVKEAAARMQVICQFARESLLSYVKNDINLTVYPGTIAIPGDLFAPLLRNSQSPVNDDESNESAPPPKKGKQAAPKSKKPISSSKRKAPSPAASPRHDDSVFGSHEEQLSPKDSASHNAKDDESSAFGYENGPTFSPPASPVAPHTQDFDKDLDVSPISKEKSPAEPAARETKKRSSVSSKKSEKKRKSIELHDAVEEFPSPLSSHGSPKKGSGRRSKKSKSTPVDVAPSAKAKKSTSTRKSKATPVSIESSKAMVNITNSGKSSKKVNAKSVAKKRAAKKPASQSTDDEFDFPHSPVKAGKSPSFSLDKSLPVRKSRASTKSKVGKAKKKEAAASPATTSPTEPSPVSTERSGRRIARAKA